jgi:hypothetical protein
MLTSVTLTVQQAFRITKTVLTSINTALNILCNYAANRPVYIVISVLSARWLSLLRENYLPLSSGEQDLYRLYLRTTTIAYHILDVTVFTKHWRSCPLRPDHHPDNVRVLTKAQAAKHIFALVLRIAAVFDSLAATGAVGFPWTICSRVSYCSVQVPVNKCTYHWQVISRLIGIFLTPLTLAALGTRPVARPWTQQCSGFQRVCLYAHTFIYVYNAVSYIYSLYA